ncbi:MAG: YceH family protein [Deltaproteobacteria bacterium]|jgi:uncharacterized protein YceH (UPF0502 family)|nr:YceH family protein [Deltaproteobacteria bacterium]
MEFNLNTIEARVLGCLIEKELATPEYYPLTLNALTSACNQKSNRAPVLALGESDVQQALDSLRRRQFAHVSAEGVRSVKYCHNLEGLLKLEPSELAVLAELLLRGPQTLGELRSRAARMHPFADLAEVDESLQALLGRDEPLVAKLARQPGRKESRYAQLLGGMPEVNEGVSDTPLSEQTSQQDRIAALESEMAILRRDFEAMQKDLAQFKAQFE